MTQKTLLWTPSQLEQITQGEWASDRPKKLLITNVALYKEEIQPGSIVITMSANHWDEKCAHTSPQIAEFFAAGASAVITETSPPDLALQQLILLVKNSRIALDRLAKAARDRFTGRVLCISGSIGKTNIKEMLQFALAQQGSTYTTIENDNNKEHQLALSIANTPPAIINAIYEFAINPTDHLLKRARMAQPHIAMITALEPVHLDKYPALETLANQQSLLIDSLEPSGIVILNRDNGYFDQLQTTAIKKGVSRIITFGTDPLSDICLINCSLTSDASYVKVSVFGDAYLYKIALPGYHLVKSSLAMLAGVEAIEGNWQLAADSLKSLPFDSLNNGTLHIRSQSGNITTSAKKTILTPSKKSTASFKKTLDMNTKKEFEAIFSNILSSDTTLKPKVKSLNKDENQHAMYIESPITPAKLKQEETGTKKVGLICDISNGGPLTEVRQSWKYGAISVDRILKKSNIQLLIYSPKDVDLSTKSVKAYYIDNKELVSIDAKLPQINYNWYLNSITSRQKPGPDLNEYRKFAETNSIQIFPYTELTYLSKDKYLAYRLIKKINPTIQLETDIYQHNEKQITRYLRISEFIFLKPLVDNNENEIILVKKEKKQFILIFYPRGREITLTPTSINQLSEQIDTIIGRKKYIIQTGIKTIKYRTRSFDIRVNMINDGEGWRWLHQTRVGPSNSELSNALANKSFYKTESLLTEVVGESKKDDILLQLKKISSEIIHYFDTYIPHFLNEIVFDFIIGEELDVFLCEINSEPGLARAPHKFSKSMDHSEEREQLLKQYSLQHSQYISEFFLSGLRKLSK